ncbi:serine hydrolase FSH [Syncephalis fuscata]|nr:serine hydrolase FSH [Syncephalis fuscata]
MSTSAPLKILCLHGYMQNGQVLRRKMGAVRKKLKNVAELVFITSSHPQARLQKLYNSEGGELHPYAWWFGSEDGLIYRGAEESLKQIRDVLAEQGPFDGIFGFSQGAVFASMLASIYSKPDHPLRYGSSHSAFQFSMLVSGFKARSPDYASLYETPIKCPSFHAIGAEDLVVPSAASEALAKLFDNPTVYRHDGAHVIPTNAAARLAFTEFIKPFVTGSPSLMDIESIPKI